MKFLTLLHCLPFEHILCLCDYYKLLRKTKTKKSSFHLFHSLHLVNRLVDRSLAVVISSLVSMILYDDDDYDGEDNHDEPQELTSTIYKCMRNFVILRFVIMSIISAMEWMCTSIKYQIMMTRDFSWGHSMLSMIWMGISDWYFLSPWKIWSNSTLLLINFTFD